MGREKVIRSTFYTYFPKKGFKLKQPFEDCDVLPVQDSKNYNPQLQLNEFKLKHLLPPTIIDQVWDWELLGSSDFEDAWFQQLQDYEQHWFQFKPSAVGRVINTILIMTPDELKETLKIATMVPGVCSTYLLPPVPVIQMYRIEVAEPEDKEDAKAFFVEKKFINMTNVIAYGFMAKVRLMMRGERLYEGNIFTEFNFFGRAREDDGTFYRYFCTYVGERHVLMHCDKDKVPLHIDDVCLTSHEMHNLVINSQLPRCCSGFIEKIERKQSSMRKKINAWVRQNLIPDNEPTRCSHKLKRLPNRSSVGSRKREFHERFSHADSSNSRRYRNEPTKRHGSRRMRETSAKHKQTILYKDCNVRNYYKY